MPDDWFSASTQPQASPQAQPRVRPVFTAPPKAPDPLQINQDRRAEQDQRMQEQKFDLDLEKNQRDAAKDSLALDPANAPAVQLAGRLRDDFKQSEAVKNYNSALPVYATAMQTPNTPEGDLNLIYAFAKIMDPGSVVREGEMGMVTGASPAVERIAAQFGKQVLEGGSFTPEARARLRNELTRRVADYNRLYKSERERFGGIAQRYGINLDEVVGPHSGDAVAGQIREAQQDRGVGDQQPVAPLGKGVSPVNSPEQLKAMYPDAQRFMFDESGEVVGLINADGQFEEVIATSPISDEELAKERDTFGGAVDTLFRSGADVVTGSFADEIAAGLSTAFGEGSYQKNLAAQRQIDRVDRDVNPIASGVGMVGGALMLPTGIGNAMRSGGLRAASIQGAREGAAYGGAYGFGSGENMQDRSLNALAGAGLGAGVGAAAPFAVNALSKIGGRGKGNALLSDAQSLGVDLMPADVGGATVKRFSAGAAQNPASAERMYKGFEQTQEQMGSALGQTARKNASPLPIDDAGELVRGGAKRFSENTSARGGRLYEQAISAAKGVKIKPQGAIAEIDKNIADLAQSGEVAKPLIKELQSFRNSLAQQGGLTVEGLRGVRTALRDEIAKQGLRGSNTDRIFNNVLETAAQDMEAGLRAVGRDGAANAFQRADAFWKQRVETIDEVLDPLIGKNAPKSGEAILTEIERMAQGKGRGVANLSRVMAELSPKEAEGVRATIIERLGLANAGNQGADGGKFAASSFLTNWNKLSPKGKAILFKPEHRADLDKIARLAEATKDTQRFANTSGTAGATLSQPSVGGIIMYIPQNAIGRLLSSQAFTSWLARAPRSTAGQEAHIAQLSKVSTRVPALSADIKGLQQSLVEAFQPAQLAAEPEPKR